MLSEKEQKAINLFSEAAKLLEWRITFAGDDVELKGIVIGTEDYIERVNTIVEAWETRS